MLVHAVQHEHVHRTIVLYAALFYIWLWGCCVSICVSETLKRFHRFINPNYCRRSFITRWNWHCFWNLAVETFCDDHFDIAKTKIRAWHLSPSARVTQTLAICFCFHLCWSCVCVWWSRVVTELLTAGREDKQCRDTFLKGAVFELTLDIGRFGRKTKEIGRDGWSAQKTRARTEEEEEPVKKRGKGRQKERKKGAGM